MQIQWRPVLRVVVVSLVGPNPILARRRWMEMEMKKKDGHWFPLVKLTSGGNLYVVRMSGGLGKDWEGPITNERPGQGWVLWLYASGLFCHQEAFEFSDLN